MRLGDIVRGKRGSFVGLCATNKLPSGNVVLIFHNGHDFKTVIKNSNDMEVIEFADGRINEALFPKNERAEEQRFEEEFYQPDIGQPVRPADRIDIPINADRLQEWARVVQRPQWVENPYIVDDRPEEPVQDEPAEVYGL